VGELELSVQRQRIVDIVIEIRGKRELARIYEANIRYLQEQRTQLGPATPVYLINEIRVMSR
jgi:hypothetical protein